MFPISNPVAIIFVVLLIILAGPVVFRRLKIPSVVGLIIAGIMVGPYGFGLLERDASFKIFGEVGILYIMFQAAVEIDMFHLKQNVKHGAVFGLMSFLLPMVAGIFGSRYAFGVGWDTAVLIASMYASHTLVSYPVVSRFGLQNTRGAVVAVCGTIVAVLLALFCLAGVVDIRVNGHFDVSRLLLLLLWMAIYMVVTGYLFPRLTRRFFRSNSDPVAQYIFILALVLAASLIAQLIGLEAILGAFYAGLVLNPMIPARSPLMKNIRFMGDSIFVPYFLIGVGMLINVGVVVRGWDVAWVALNMSLVALVTKWLAAFSAQKLFGFDTCDRRLMFGLSSGKAAATIAAVMLGWQYHMISEDVMNGAVVMILICCIVASLVTENAAKHIRIRITAESLSHDELGSTELARQVVSVSNPLTSEGLMRMAVVMRARRNRNPVTALFVRTDSDLRHTTMGRNALHSAELAAEDMDVEVNAIERFDISVVSALRNVAMEQNATEIIIGFHRKSNIVDSFFGSLAEQLVSSTDKMIFLSRCFIPVDTLTHIHVYVPNKAEFETGFHLWVSRLSMLAANIEASLTFISYRATEDFIRAVIAEDRVEADFSFKTMEAPDDFILLSGDISDDDLLVVVGARKGSISHDSELEAIPGFLEKHFSRQNLLMLYPKQF